LESYAGSTVNFQFKGQYGSGGYSYGICVDDVGVLETFDYPDGDPITIGEGEEAVTITIDGGNANNVPGYYQVSWDGRDANGRAVSTGVYFYRMQSGKYDPPRRWYYPNKII